MTLNGFAMQGFVNTGFISCHVQERWTTGLSAQTATFSVFSWYWLWLSWNFQKTCPSLGYTVRLYVEIQSLCINTPETQAASKRCDLIFVLTQRTEVDSLSDMFVIMISDITYDRRWKTNVFLSLRVFKSTSPSSLWQFCNHPLTKHAGWGEVILNYHRTTSRKKVALLSQCKTQTSYFQHWITWISLIYKYRDINTSDFATLVQ